MSLCAESSLLSHSTNVDSNSPYQAGGDVRSVQVSLVSILLEVEMT